VTLAVFAGNDDFRMFVVFGIKPMFSCKFFNYAQVWRLGGWRSPSRALQCSACKIIWQGILPPMFGWLTW
jgi:hypothetical protein